MIAAARCSTEAAAHAGEGSPKTPASGHSRSAAAFVFFGVALHFTGGAMADPHVSCGDYRIGTAVVVYAQRVASDGSVDPAWIPDAARLCVGVGHEYAFAATPDSVSPTVVSWAELSRDGSDIRAQRLDPGGTVTATWPAAGAPVSGAPLDQHGPHATSDGAGG